MRIRIEITDDEYPKALHTFVVEAPLPQLRWEAIVAGKYALRTALTQAWGSSAFEEFDEYASE